MMTPEQFRTHLRAYVGGCGDQQQAAHRLGISPAYLNDVLHGRREPGPKLLGSLGMRRVTMYTLAPPQKKR
jgi:hypothetical protein